MSCYAAIPYTMNWDDIIADVPANLYCDTCAAARRAAADENYGNQDAAEQFDSMLPHEIASRIWDSDESDVTKLDLAIRAYTEMPCYGHALYFSLNYSGLSPGAREKFWAWFRSVLSASDNVLANPLEYSLWCDFFEADTDRATEAWSRLVDAESSNLLVQRVLISSGPAPYAFKEELYQRLLPDKNWHYYIFLSIRNSMYDVFGRIDLYRAKQVLKRLELSADTEGLAEVRKWMKNVRKNTPPKGEERIKRQNCGITKSSAG